MTEAVPVLRLIGLCAAWCGVCRKFQPTFAQVQSSYAELAPGFEAHWVDVEDPAISDALGEIDIETFPTVAIGYGNMLVFWGEILPSEAVLRQLIVRLDTQPSAAAQEPALQAAWRALCAQVWP